MKNKIYQFGLLSILVLLSSCGSMQSKMDQLRIGDKKDRVIDVLGQPDDAVSNGENVAWRYCVSGSEFGANDHRDILFRKEKVITMYSYKTNVTGCSRGFQPIRWQKVGMDFSIDSARDNCKQLGFKVDTESMSNCLLMQQKMLQDSKSRDYK